MSPELQKSTETFWHATFRDPIATFTFFLFAATIVLAISTVMLWWTTRRLAIDTKESGEGQADRMERSIGEAGRSALAMESVAKSMELNATKIVESVAMQAKFGETQLRSYLAILIGVGVYQDEKLRFEVRPKILNTGFTPARNVMWRIGIAVLPDPILKTTRFPKTTTGGQDAVIAPHNEYTMSAVLDYRLPDEEAVAIKYGTGNERLTVWGYVSYRDIFNRVQRYTFAQQVWWTDVKDGLIMNGLYLPRHNRCT